MTEEKEQAVARKEQPGRTAKKKAAVKGLHPKEEQGGQQALDGELPNPADCLKQAEASTTCESVAAAEVKEAKPQTPKRHTKKEKEASALLREATIRAVGLLSEVMQNPEAKLELRVDCAKEVLNRVYGKAGQPLDTAANNDSKVTFLLEGELKDYAR